MVTRIITNACIDEIGWYWIKFKDENKSYELCYQDKALMAANLTQKEIDRINVLLRLCPYKA